MERDWDCVRAILVALEDKANATDPMPPAAVEEFDAQKVSYHMKLMIEAALIEGNCAKGGYPCFAKSMTWEGHELLDKIRSEAVWNQVKKMAREKGVSLSFEAVKILGTAALKHYIGG
jgi:hypothetical protein